MHTWNTIVSNKRNTAAPLHMCLQIIALPASDLLCGITFWCCQLKLVNANCSCQWQDISRAAELFAVLGNVVFLNTPVQVSYLTCVSAKKNIALKILFI